MHCIKCGTALPPETATCPTCGTSTPYNVTISSTPNTGVEETPSSSLAWQVEPQPSSDWQEYQSTSEHQTPQSEVSQPVTPQPTPVSQQPQPTSQSLADQSLPIQQEAQRRDSSLARPLLLTILALLIIGGGGLIYYVSIGRPAEFHAQATAIAQTFLTPVSPQDVYTNSTSGKPMINDPLNSPGSSTWRASGGIGNSCAFTNGAYHLSMSGNTFITQCFSKAGSLSDFAFQVRMTITQGSLGGLVFRVDDTQSNYYFFFVRSDGFYGLLLHTSTNQVKLLNYGPSSAINAGLNQQNLLTVIARGSSIYLYVNKQYIATANDPTFRSGGIGLFASREVNPTGDVAFSNAQVWKL